MKQKTITIKRQYEKPAMRVFELQGRRSMILCGSPVGAKNSIKDWSDGGTDEEEIFL